MLNLASPIVFQQAQALSQIKVDLLSWCWRHLHGYMFNSIQNRIYWWEIGCEFYLVSQVSVMTNHMTYLDAYIWRISTANQFVSWTFTLSISSFRYATIHVLITWSDSTSSPSIFLIFPTVPLNPCLSHSDLISLYLGSSLYCPIALIFHLIHTVSYLSDYLHTFYIRLLFYVQHSSYWTFYSLISRHCSHCHSY